MFAGINTVKLIVVDRHVVQVTGAGHELHHLNDLTCLHVIFDDAWSVTVIAGGALLLMSAHLPDETAIAGDAVEPFRKPWRAGGWEHVIHHPSLRIYADQRFKTIRVDPDFFGIGLPGHTVGGTAIVSRSEWDLSMADLLAVHIGLKYPINRRSGVL